MKNKIIIPSLYLLFSLIFLGCSSSTKQANLIVIDEFINSGIKVNFYIGTNQDEIFQLINKYDFKLDAVDSSYVFIIEKGEFEKLKTALQADKDNGSLSPDSISSTEPRIIRARVLSTDTLISKEYSEYSFKNKVSDRLGISNANLSKNAKELFERLKKHSFIY